MGDVFIINAVRSAVGKAFRGSLASTRPDDLAASVVKSMMAKTPELDPQLVDDVIVGCAMPEAEQGMNVARFISLLAGLPDTVPAVTINRFCSSGLQSIAMAYDRVKAGNADCIIAGGTETMTLVPMMGHKVVGSRNVNDNHPDFYLGMGLTAENVADEYKISREAQDEFSYNSHRKAAAAIKNGLFKDEIVDYEVSFRKAAGEGKTEVLSKTFNTDEGPREDTTPEALGKLRPVFKARGSVTAGNSSQMSDGAGFCIVASEEFVKKHNLKPEAKFLGFDVAGVPPRIMGIGPVAAIPKALKRAGLKQDDIQRVELNEAFAAQSLAVLQDLKLNPEIVNPTGGAIALGHPLGATGAKLTATLLKGMRRDKQKYGMVTMCIGTGMGAAGVFELV